MNTTFANLFSIRGRYNNPLERSQAQAMWRINWLIAFGSFLWLGYQLFGRPEAPLAEIAVPAIALVLSVGVVFALRQGRLLAASYLIVMLASVAAGVAVLLTDTSVRYINVLLPIALAGVLLRRGGIIITGTAMVLAAVVATIADLNAAALTLEGAITQALGYSIVIGLASVIQAMFIGGQRAVAREAYQETSGLQRVLQKMRDIDVTMPPDAVYSRLIRLLREVYGLENVQVYLLDDEQHLSGLVRAGIRSVERIKLEGDEVITIGTPHPLSDAARFRQPIQVTLDDAPRRREFFLFSVQRSLSVPIIDGDQVLGVVDIQSTVSEPFSQQEIDMIMTVVGSFATLTHLLETVETLRRGLREQENVTNRMQNQLTNLQAQRQQMVSDVWSDYIETQGRTTLGYNIQANQILRAEDLPDAMRQALDAEDIYIGVEDDAKVMTVPIRLRGQTLGAMSFSMPLDRVVTERQAELARTVAGRLSTALESARLLEQTRLQAQRERQATAVANLLFGATDVDSLLRLAADSFNDTLGAIQTRIFIEPNKLAPPSQLPPAPNGGGTQGNGTNGHHHGDSQ